MRAGWRVALLCLLFGTLVHAAEPSPALQFSSVQRLILPIVTEDFQAPAGRLLRSLPEEGWQTVTLPDVAMPRTVARADERQVQTTWYSVHLDKPLLASQAPLYLYLPRWQTVGQVAVYGDGRLLWRSEGDPVWNGFNQPLWIALDGLDARTRPSELLLRMDSTLGQGAGISSLWVGPQAELQGRYRWRMAVQVYLPPAIGVAFLALGIFAIAVWRTRREPIYGLFFIASLLYAMRCLHYVGPLDEQLFPSDWFGWLTVNSMNWMATIGVLFNFHLSRQRRPWLERSLLAVATGGCLLTMPWLVSSQHIAALAAVTHGTLWLLTLVAVAVLLKQTWRGPGVAKALAWLNLLSIPTAAHDLLLQNYQLSLEQPYLMPFWEIGFCLLFSYVLLSRYLASIQGLERSQELLATTLAQREAELAASYQQLHAIEQRQTLARERQRLMQDMHDGLGSSLTGALRMAERGSAVADIEQVLRECMDELKLTIDSLEPMEADLTLLLATLRYRLQPRLSAAGISLHWQVQSLPSLDWLTPGNALHVLRIVQEVVSNILKHAQAEHITFSTETSEFGVAVRVSDDGIGFVPSQQISGSGRGVGNIRSRAAALSSEVRWAQGQSGQGTVFTLWLPLAGPNAG